jgi:Domain of unknown function (DUF4270)
MDSLRTTNITGETLRVLAGNYNDPVFGTAQSQAYMQFGPTSLTTVLPTTAIYDSVVLQLRYDFYSYGSQGETPQTYAVHEILDTLFTTKNYYSNSTVSLSRSPLGSATVNVNQEFFKSEFDDSNADSVLTLRVKLSNGFGQRLYDAIDVEDENYTNFEQFKNIFKGLAVLPTNCDKVTGFNLTDLNSVLTLYYHDGDQKKTVLFSLAKGVTFSQITPNRASTELSGLDQYYTEFNSGFNGYVQAGTSVVTKLDFSKFYEYTDTIPNLVINSAELVITDSEQSSVFYKPRSLALTLLRTNNRYKIYVEDPDNPEAPDPDYANLNGVVTLGDELKFFVSFDQGGILNLNYNSTDNTYIGYPTLFFQRLFDLKDSRYPYIALRPADPQPGKSLNRLVFPKDRIKLKLYYTRPTLSEN